MAANQNYRLQAATLDADRDTLLAIRDLGDYAPVNHSHSVETLNQMRQALALAEETEVRAQKALVAARDAAIKAAWEFHGAIRGAKAQVIAQYGDDSAAVQAIGLKKTSDRKRPVRRAAAPAPTSQN